MLKPHLGLQIPIPQRFSSSAQLLQTDDEEHARDGTITTHTLPNGHVQHSEELSSSQPMAVIHEEPSVHPSIIAARPRSRERGRARSWWGRGNRNIPTPAVRPQLRPIQKHREPLRLPAHITQPSLYPSGRPWRAEPIQPLNTRSPVPPLDAPPIKQYFPSKFGLSINMERLRESLLHTMATTHLDTEAWDAYSNLLLIDVNTEGPTEELLVPRLYLRRLSRLLARTRPKTRKVFLRQLSVLTAIRNSGGPIQLYEWNSLIDLSGKGWRQTRTQDFETALSIYKDMIHGKAPGSTLASRDLEEDEEDEYHGELAIPLKPDIYSHTTLISLAARTLDLDSLSHATKLLERSQLAPNRITHLAMLQYFTFTHDLAGVRSTLFKMRQQGFELGIDGINAVIWAYGNNDRIDIVMMIYRLLRHHVSPERHVGEDDIQAVITQLRDEEQIILDPAIKPNEITFTMMIQVMAYKGNLLATLTVFMDMVSSQNLEMGAPLIVDEEENLVPSVYSPTLPVFRAIFLGFARNALPPPKKGYHVPERVRLANPPGKPTWTLDNLQSLFDTFMGLPGRVQISQLTVYWIMKAFEVTSDNEAKLLRQVWKQLEDRFGGPWGMPGSRLYEMRMKLFPGDTGPFERKKWDREAGHDLPPHLLAAVKRPGEG